MLVEELVLDGFKSYAVRTVVSSWDPQFNAITGLNGSGKSNILDAICFVLGITSMTTVRASNLQDLIYKRGQAGITKASVTITFDNSDKSKSPIGFDDKPKISITRQVILGGASKYLINGHKAQQTQVLNLFQSVQLNINNPNFLIMQGKITKMLNMKATEILGLIEEAAGTKMYENEKAKAENTMRKKNKKLQETEELLQEEVEPKLKRLTKQKSEVLEFQNIQQQLETLTKAVAAHDYKTYSEMMANHETLVSQAKNDFEENKSEIQTLTNEIANLEGDLEKMKAQKQYEMNKADLSRTYEAAETKIANEATRLTTTRDFKQQGIDEQKKKLQDIELQLQRLQNSIENKNENYENMRIELEKSKQELEQDKRLLQKKEDLLSTLSTGISSKGSTDGGYMAHLQDAKKKLSDVSIQMKQEKMKTQRLETEMNSNKSKVQNAQDELKKIQLQIESRLRQIEILASKLQQTGFDAARFQQLKAHEKNLRYELSRASQQLQDFRRLNPNFDFTYELPYPNFDTKSVKGLVGELFSLPAENSRSITALEVCAGGRVFNVVVDTSDTGSLILDKGRLRKRVTIIPLDKISSRVMDKRALAAAKSISPNKVKLALDLVEYKDDVTRAMQYIFGNRLICDDPETAKKVTFDPSVRTGSITLDGDYYDPEGRLSGGSRRASSTLLMNFKTYQDLKNKVMKFEMELDNLFNELKQQSILSETTQSIQHDLNVEKHQVEILQKQLDQSPSAAVVKKQTSSIEDIKRIKENIGNLTERASSIEADILSIEKDMKEFNSDGSSKLRELKSEVNTLSSKFKAAEKELKTKQINFNNFQIENDQMNSDIAALKEEKELSINLIREFTGELLTINEELEGLTLKAVEISDKIKTEKERIMSINEELSEMSRILNVKRTNLYDSKLRLTKSQARYTEISGSFNELKSKLSDILRNNPWVRDERHLQNVLSQNHGMVSESAHRIIDNLTTRAESMMKKGINDNIMTQIEQHEKHETALKSKIRQINKDKTNIEATIRKLDDYKRTELVKTYQKVSKDFGQIFSDLLPHAYAKLVPVSVTDVSKGLEVKVKLGNVWKESLVELSGGQRSLVALSLILSLLQFKPAPMYILDEVDAALDLSHTQNIGHLIKTRFKGSQFIVVSLKEGMFTNANRLFKVRFQEGTSVVTAT